MVNERWRLDVGSWKLEVGRWKLDVGSWKLTMVDRFVNANCKLLIC